MLKLSLFGVPQASYLDRPLEGFPSQQHGLLLCYLFLNRRRPHQRERLAAIFWSEYPTPVARKYLRNSIWKARQVLRSAGVPADEYLSANNGNVSFKCSGRYWLDIEIFETRLSLYQDIAGQQLTPEQAAQLEEAVDLYVGDLLEGIYEDWCLYDRERLMLLYLNALDKLMAFHEANGTYEHGLACGERTLAQDNTREKAHRQMMRLYWLSGNQSAALAQYKRCAQILRETLNVSPMEATTRLYQQIVHGQFHPSKWPGHCTVAPPFTLPVDGVVQTMTEDVLQRVHYLQATIEEAKSELRHIEHLISEGMAQFPQLYGERLIAT